MAAVAKNRKEIEAWLVDWVSRTVERASEEVTLDGALADFGVDSSRAVGLISDLEKWLGHDLEATLLWDYPTIHALSTYLTKQAP
jgi:acyl carrier protein